MSAGFVTCPILMSERISNNLRDEMRRFEDKFDAKGLANIMVTLRMELPPSSKKVPIVHGWLVVDQSTMSENIFMSSQLVLDRSPRKMIPFAPETSYIVPSAERDALPHASEGNRSLSQTQESSQYLSGEHFPEAILSGLLTRAALPSKTLAVLNCTPYDCWLERTCLK
ncbi:unnamed protein product [Durusdinium trenchii]|uniref:Uncharacterized protein n=2 Tax=Durusdinium trenchii TaxID=1381693 RepID=A0ABP0R343_9DINO